MVFLCFWCNVSPQKLLYLSTKFNAFTWIRNFDGFRSDLCPLKTNADIFYGNGVCLGRLRLCQTVFRDKTSILKLTLIHIDNYQVELYQCSNFGIESVFLIYTLITSTLAEVIIKVWPWNVNLLHSVRLHFQLFWITRKWPAYQPAFFGARKGPSGPWLNIVTHRVHRRALRSLNLK